MKNLIWPSDVGAKTRLSFVEVLGVLIRVKVIDKSFVKLYRDRMEWLAKHDVDEQIQAACQKELDKLKELSG